MDKREVIVDCDFLSDLLKNTSKDFFIQLMDELGVRPIVHSYVADVELEYCKEAQELIQSGYIRKIEYAEYLQDETQRMQYNQSVWQILDIINDDDLPPEKYQDVFRKGFSYKTHSIGEVMSELMAKELKLELFASNDFGAKSVAKRHINSARYELKVRNLAELLREVGQRENTLKWKDIKDALRDERWKREKDKIRKFWVKN